MTNPESESVPRVRLGVHLSGTLGIPGSWRGGYKPAERGWGGRAGRERDCRKEPLEAQKRENPLLWGLASAWGTAEDERAKFAPGKLGLLSVNHTHPGVGIPSLLPGPTACHSELQACPLPALFLLVSNGLDFYFSISGVREKELGFLGFLSR